MGKRPIQVAVVVALVALAGCSGVGELATGSTATFSASEVTVDDGDAVVTVEYELQDDATAILEGPGGGVIAEESLSADDSTADIPLNDRSGGEYHIRIERNNETVREENLTLSAPDPRITSVSSNWSENRLQTLTLTVENRGEIPARVVDPQIQFRSSTIAGETTTAWIEGNETRQVTVSPGYREGAVSTPGDVRVRASLNTSDGRISDTVTKHFDGANLSITNVSPEWSGTTLSAVDVQVSNTGDLPATANASVYDSSTELVSADRDTVGINESATFRLGGQYNTVFTHETGGTVELDVVVDSTAGFDEETITHNVVPADVTVESVTADWNDGKLERIEFTARNDGEIAAEITPRITAGDTVILDGVSTAGDIFIDDSATIPPNTTTTVELGADDGPYVTATEGGEITVSVTADGSTATDTTEFDDAEIDVTPVDVGFDESYSGETAELSTVEVRIENTGGIPLDYDAIEVELNGATAEDGVSLISPLGPGDSQEHWVLFVDGITTEPGTYDMTVRVVSENDETLASDTVEVSSE